MTDEADIAADEIEAEIQRRIAQVRADIPPGVPGECDLCGEWSGRLIDGACAPCRDRHTKHARLNVRVVDDD